MGAVFGAGPDLPYVERTAVLIACQVAVWDVLHASVRPGSMDADIENASAEVNDFKSFFDAHGELRRVCFNGKKSAELFQRLVRPKLGGTIVDLEFRTLPSTSPAHAAMSFERKLAHWAVIRM